MLRSKFVLLAMSSLVLLGSSSNGTHLENTLTTQGNTQHTQSWKFDEFEHAAINDLRARLDNLAIELEQEPDTKATLIVYAAGYCSRPGEAINLGNFAKEYLVNSKGVENERIRIINGGFRKTQFYEIWIVPLKAAEPTATPSIASKKAIIRKRCLAALPRVR